jgi:hypothetical protein
MAFALIMHGVAAWITAKRLEAERSSASGRSHPAWPAAVPPPSDEAAGQPRRTVARSAAGSFEAALAQGPEWLGRDGPGGPAAVLDEVSAGGSAGPGFACDVGVARFRRQVEGAEGGDQRRRGFRAGAVAGQATAVPSADTMPLGCRSQITKGLTRPGNAWAHRPPKGC